MLWILLAQTVPAIPDTLAGGSGWIGAGLLGAVLSWIFFVHLPTKDKQIIELLKMNQDDREKSRISRHELAQVFQKAIADMYVEHREDAKADRESYDSRQNRLEDAIRVQTAQLEAAMLRGGCKFVPQFTAMPGAK